MRTARRGWAAATLAVLVAASGVAVASDSRRAGAAAPAVKTVVRGLEIPWEIAFLPDRRALITERPGRVRVLTKSGRLRRTPAARVRVQALGEGGLLGLALDPSFRRNRFVYLYYTTGSGMVLARYRMRGNRLFRVRTILAGIRAGSNHDSGRIAFGPDRKLYVATGDAGDPDLAQRPNSLNGKFLRLSAGSYRGSGGRAEIVSSGHRNPQGLDWQPGSRRLIATEHGPTGNDEINHIRPGQNYGWPIVDGPDHGRFTAPLVVYGSSMRRRAPPSSPGAARRGRAATSWRRWGASTSGASCSTAIRS